MPKDSEVKVSVMMEPALRDKLAVLAGKDGRSLTRFIQKHMETVAAKAEKSS